MLRGVSGQTSPHHVSSTSSSSSGSSSSAGGDSAGTLSARFIAGISGELHSKKVRLTEILHLGAGVMGSSGKECSVEAGDGRRDVVLDAYPSLAQPAAHPDGDATMLQDWPIASPVSDMALFSTIKLWAICPSNQRSAANRPMCGALSRYCTPPERRGGAKA